MVIFHSFLLVYQKVKTRKTQKHHWFEPRNTFEVLYAKAIRNTALGPARFGSSGISLNDEPMAWRSSNKNHLWWTMGYTWLPSGERTKNYGKIHHLLMEKSTISTGPFSIAFCMFTRGYTCLFCCCKSAQHPRMPCRTLSDIYFLYKKPKHSNCCQWALCGKTQRPSTGHGRGGTSRSRLPGSLSAGKK